MQAHARFKEEVYNIADINTDDAPADVHGQLTGDDTTIATL